MRTPTQARRPMPTGMRRWLRTALAGSLVFGGALTAWWSAGHSLLRPPRSSRPSAWATIPTASRPTAPTSGWRTTAATR